MSADYRLNEDVAIITLNRPSRFNAIDTGLSRALVESLARAGEEARAAVVTGAGKAFCSGADLAELLEEYENDGPDLGRTLDEVFHPVVHALADCGVPTIAAINGVAAGAGLGVALGCDLRVMAESGSLTSAFTGIGLVPDSGTTWLLPRHLGVARALDFALTNRRVGPGEALSLGLCSQVVPDGELEGSAVAMATRMADLVPDSLVTTRRLIRGSGGMSFEDALAAERVEQARLGKTPEHIEGVRAFMEKRPPNYRET